MTSYYGKMLMIPYYIYINHQVTHVYFIICDRKKNNANCNTFIHVLTLDAVVFFIWSSLDTPQCNVTLGNSHINFTRYKITPQNLKITFLRWSRGIASKEALEFQNSGLIFKFTQQKFNTRLRSAVLQMATCVHCHEYRIIEYFSRQE
jgi:hypothetical protein